MTLTFHALWMLCALGSAVFAAVPARSASPFVALAAGFAASEFWLSATRLPDHAWLGLATAGAAMAMLARPRYVLIGLALAGVLAGAWSALLEAQGVHPLLALAATATVPAASISLAAGRPGFVSPHIRDEALLGLVVCGVVVAMLPGVMDGWRAGVNLSLMGEAAASPMAIPAWTLVVGLMALVGGGAYSLWSRR